MDKILAAKEILRCAQNDDIANTNEAGGHVERSETSIWEKQIDTLVYKLYGLSFEEAKVIDPELTEGDFDGAVVENS